MKLRLFFAIVIVFVIAGCFMWLLPPILKTKQPHWDFGTISANQPLSGEFLISNFSVKPLKLNMVRSTCPCIKVVFPESLKPGETGKLQLAVRSNSYDGRFQGKIYLFSNAQGSPHEFTFSGLAMPPYKVSPSPDFYLGRIRKNDIKIRKFIIDAENTDLVFGQVQCNADDSIEVSWRRLRTGRYEVVIRLQKITVPAKNFSLGIEIPILQPGDYPPVKFQISGYVID